MSDLVGNPEDRFSHDVAHLQEINHFNTVVITLFLFVTKQNNNKKTGMFMVLHGIFKSMLHFKG